jgi:peptidoglycan-N-acetylglucosamine deacetylase
VWKHKINFIRLIIRLLFYLNGVGEMKKQWLIFSVIGLSFFFIGVIFLNEISHADNSVLNYKTKLQPHKEIKHGVVPERESIITSNNDKSSIPGKVEAEEQPAPPESNPQKEQVNNQNTTEMEQPLEPLVKQVEITEAMYTAIPSENKVVALTFDDGPDDKYTKEVLNILRENQVKATFFVIGKNIKEYPSTMKEIIAEGHAVGNHTWSHARLTDLNASQIKAEMEKTNQLLKDEFGVETNLMRPPFGAMDDRTLKVLTDLQFHTVKWSVDTRDWAGTESNEMIQNVYGNVTPGGIVLQHSAGGKGGNLDNTLEALPVIIKQLKEKGYQFVTVSEMLQMAQ